ncbi:glycerophosphodiester phosphodiesterase [Paenibacillus sp. sptzw28]|uniref:glycerophosphodiester phosphodiesterase n=1 Tax=Paenibacillus sp. sptzw28 TaxID=715179 RepID=UPI001C6EB6BF|nr:glycerophosphodiester phosphodiesterase family protein [Paenibacillus sp. sptzw28]QYR19082.1 glycerophosphodiester phosphodiesterase [Paenibacillus sp. sptzw28]
MSRSFPLVTAHTGCMNCPDNTLISAETGIKLGADIIEEDIRVTRDGVAVLFHDDEVRLPEGTKYRLSHLTYPELREMNIIAAHAKGGETIRIADLKSLLSLIRSSGKMINCDLKTDGSIEAAAALARKYNMQDQIFFTGCGIQRAQLAERICPDIRKLLNADVRLFLTRGYTEAVGKTIEDALAASCSGINIDYRFVRTDLIEAADAHNLPVYVWTVNDESQMQSFARMGVYSLTTRNVKAMVGFKHSS